MLSTFSFIYLSIYVFFWFSTSQFRNAGKGLVLCNRFSDTWDSHLLGKIYVKFLSIYLYVFTTPNFWGEGQGLFYKDAMSRTFISFSFIPVNFKESEKDKVMKFVPVYWDSKKREKTKRLLYSNVREFKFMKIFGICQQANNFCTRALSFREKKLGFKKSYVRREVGGWGRDPKKCTGRDWGMGSSTI